MDRVRRAGSALFHLSVYLNVQSSGQTVRPSNSKRSLPEMLDRLCDLHVDRKTIALYDILQTGSYFGTSLIGAFKASLLRETLNQDLVGVPTRTRINFYRGRLVATCQRFLILK